MAAGLAISPVSRPASDRVTEYEANTGRRTMTDLTVFQHYEPEDQCWTEVVTNIDNHNMARILVSAWTV